MSYESGYSRHFVACNRHDPGHFVPFFIGGKRYGRIKKDTASFLSRETALFVPQNNGLSLVSDQADFDSRSAALKEATKALARHFGKDPRREMYPIVENWGDAPVAQIDRVAAPWLGVRAWGVHVNGFVRKKDGLFLWVGERAPDRFVEPGKLDNLIGGGLPIGLTLEENLCKEAKEEAGIEPSLALTAKQIRIIDYLHERTDGIRADSLFVFDLELREDFVPRNTDGEVAAFHLMPLNQVADLLCNTNKFKFNCPLVIIDFLMRHGFISPDHPEYSGLKTWLTAKVF